MIFEEREYNEIKKIKKEFNKGINDFILSFINSGYDCVEIIDNEKNYNNNNDLANVLRSRIKKENYNIKLFMLNGKVFLKRK